MSTNPSPPRKQLRRVEHTHTVRFLTFSCYRRLPLFQNDRIKQVFVDRLAALRRENRVQLFGWVLMPEHVHLLLRPTNPQDKLGVILRSLKRPIAERVIRRWRQLDAPILSQLETRPGRYRFWQAGGGYDRNLDSSDECGEKLTYVHRNPVKRGLVKIETDWQYSSARWHAERRDRALIELDAPIW